MRTAKKVVAGFAGAGVLMAGAAFAAANLPTPSGAAADMATAGVVPQVLTIPPLTADFYYGRNVYLNVTGGGSGNVVTATTKTPETCTPLAGGQELHLVGVGTCSVVYQQDGNSLYQVATPKSLSFEVLRAPLRIWVNDERRDADASNQPELEIHMAGLQNGDTPDVVQGAIVEAPALGVYAGQYAVEARGATAPNYAIDYIPGVFTVDPVIKVAGLPDQLRHVWEVNGSGTTSSRVVLPYGANGSYSFTPFLRASAGSTMYITTSTGFSGSVVRSETAHYTAMPQLIERATIDPQLQGNLKSQWSTIEQVGRPNDARTLNALHLFVDTIWSEVDSGKISGVNAWNLVRHSQVVYSAFGYTGSV